MVSRCRIAVTRWSTEGVGGSGAGVSSSWRLAPSRCAGQTNGGAVACGEGGADGGRDTGDGVSVRPYQLRPRDGDPHGVGFHAGDGGGDGVRGRRLATESPSGGGGGGVDGGEPGGSEIRKAATRPGCIGESSVMLLKCEKQHTEHTHENQDTRTPTEKEKKKTKTKQNKRHGQMKDTYVRRA